MGFKAFLLAGLGEDAYGERLAALEAGESYEVAGAWIMQVEPVTATLAGIIAPLFE